MEHPGFFERAGPFSLRAVAEAAGAAPAGEVDLETKIKDVRPLDAAAKGDLSFLDNPKYLPLFIHTGATACLVAPKFAGQAPTGTAALVTPSPIAASPRCSPYSIPMRLSPRQRGMALAVHQRASIGARAWKKALWLSLGQ